MGKTNKHIKYKRKVVLIKCKDKRETLILSKTVRRRKEKLVIEVKCNTKIKKSVKKPEPKEKYPIFKAQLRERIVPCCFRAKCSEKTQNKRTIQQKHHGHTKPKPNEINNRHETTLSSISSMQISDKPNSIEYENISSGDLSSSTDDEIEALMESTRKRMKELDDDWKLLPRHTNSSPISNKSGTTNLSINSLDTLILEADVTNKYSEINDIQNDAYSPTISPDKLIKPEWIETNNNIKLDHLSMDKQSMYDNSMNKDYFEKNNIDAVIIKLEKNDTDNLLNIKTENICVKQELYDDL